MTPAAASSRFSRKALRKFPCRTADFPAVFPAASRRTPKKSISPQDIPQRREFHSGRIDRTDRISREHPARFNPIATPAGGSVLRPATIVRKTA
ncbi:hypothetical protein ACVWZA_002537 [Sphingomonas sp. UYAg733]